MSEKSNIAFTDSKVNWWNMRNEKLRKSKTAVSAALAMNRMPWICDMCSHATDVFMSNCPGCNGVLTGFHRRRIFSLSLGDVWDGEVPLSWLVEMLYTVFRCDQCVWFLCSKRWENALNHLDKAHSWACQNASQFMDKSGFMDWLIDWETGKPPANILGLCSVEDQQRADERIPQFLRVPLACRGLSCEPLLGPIKLFDANTPDDKDPTCNGPDCKRPHIGWLIIGAESGTKRRPCEDAWIESLMAQGKSAGVATFLKQIQIAG